MYLCFLVLNSGVARRFLLPDYVRASITCPSRFECRLEAHSPTTPDGSAPRSAVWPKSGLRRTPEKQMKIPLLSRTRLKLQTFDRHQLIRLCSAFTGLIMALKDPKVSILAVMGCAQLLGLGFVNFFPT